MQVRTEAQAKMKHIQALELDKKLLESEKKLDDSKKLLERSLKKVEDMRTKVWDLQKIVDNGDDDRKNCETKLKEVGDKMDEEITNISNDI